MIQTLKDLQLDYLDLFLLHTPVASDENGAPVHIPIHKTWAEMEKLVEGGLTRAIGVSNFPVLPLFDLISCAKIKPAVNQVERHPYLLQNELVEYCKKENVQVVAFRPIGQPNAKPGQPELLKDNLIQELSKKYKKIALSDFIEMVSSTWNCSHSKKQQSRKIKTKY